MIPLYLTLSVVLTVLYLFVFLSPLYDDLMRLGALVMAIFFTVVSCAGLEQMTRELEEGQQNQAEESDQ